MRTARRINAPDNFRVGSQYWQISHRKKILDHNLKSCSYGIVLTYVTYSPIVKNRRYYTTEAYLTQGYKRYALTPIKIGFNPLSHEDAVQSLGPHLIRCRESIL